MRKIILGIIMLFTVIFTGCNKKDEINIPTAQKEIIISKVFRGDETSFEKMKDIWKKLSEEETEISKEEIFEWDWLIYSKLITGTYTPYHEEKYRRNK